MGLIRSGLGLVTKSLNINTESRVKAVTIESFRFEDKNEHE